MKISKSTEVRLLTTNGGDTVATLLEDYVPSYGAVLSRNGGKNYFIVDALRIKSITPTGGAA